MEQNRFYELAEQTIGGSHVITGHEKISTDEVIKTYPDGITLTAFDIIPNDAGGYAVFTFSEAPTKFLNGGTLLTKMAFQWANAFDGDVEEASAKLTECGGVKVKLTSKRTKRGNTITAVEILK